MHQEQHRQRRLAGFRRARPLAVHRELHLALLGPVLVAPDRGIRRLGVVGAGGSGRQLRDETGAETKPRALDQRAAADRMIR